jgi:MFS family permease
MKGDFKMVKKVQLKKNINRNYIYIMLQNVDFTRGIWMIYLAKKGMSLTELGLLETIFHITSFTMEVPTGAIADLFSRKLSRILGRVFSLISVILLLISTNFGGFAIAFGFTAISYNLESGAGDALIYDSLKEIGEEDTYMKVCGKNEVFYQIAGAISFLAGGYLAIKNYGIAFVLTIIFGTLTILQSLTFKEPSIGKRKHEEDKNKNKDKSNIFIVQLRESIKVIRNNTKIGVLIVFLEVIMAFCTCMFFYLQNYLKGNGYNEATIGIIYAIASMASALTATQVHKIHRRIKEKGILLFIPIVAVVCVWGLSLGNYPYIFFVLLMICEGIIFVATNDYINKMVPSQYRATILSFGSMVFSFFMITLFPLIGLIGDKYSLCTALKCLALFGTILILINSWVLITSKEK